MNSRSISLCLVCISTLCLVFSAGFAIASEAGEEGFVSLFNGKDLTGWDGDPRLWSVEDGVIVGRTTPETKITHNTFLFWRQGEVDDFELRLSIMIVGGNSGIQYRSKDFGDWISGGYQGDFEAGDNYSGILYEEKGRGILALRGEKVLMSAEGEKKVVETFADAKDIEKNIKKEDWNEYTIIARGNHLIHKINGVTTMEFTDEQVDKRSMSGILAFQLHVGNPMTIRIKDVRLKRMNLKDGKKIVLVAGPPSHGHGLHEFNAGTILLKKWLDSVPGIVTARYQNGWPQDPSAYDNADAIVFFMDGGAGHPIIQGDRLQQLDALAKKGTGIACLHYAVEVPKERGGKELLDWIGGYYETGFSTNPHWIAEFKNLPNHPICRGVKDFTLKDEWYFNIRFRPEMEGIKTILAATPPDDVRRTEAAAKHPGRAEVLAWAVERPDGGRGFGFTGGHFHESWGDDNYRKLVLNALVWTAGAEVPADGIASSVTAEELAQNLD